MAQEKEWILFSCNQTTFRWRRFSRQESEHSSAHQHCLSWASHSTQFDNLDVTVLHVGKVSHDNDELPSSHTETITGAELSSELLSTTLEHHQCHAIKVEWQHRC